MKKTLAVVVSVAALGVVCWVGLASARPASPAASAAKAGFSAIVYVAGHGGHFAKAEVSVDPSNAESPIKVASLDMVNVGTSESHKLHDGRIDARDANTMFWSTYALDKEGKLHVGKTDLKTGNVVKDVALTPDERAPAKTGPAYCASGQGKSTFMPVFMGNEGYIDVWDKQTLQLKHRVFVSDLGYKAGTYQFVHGTNSNDLKKFVVAITMKGEDGKMNGKQDVIVLDLPSLEKGKLKQLAKATLTGEPGKTITFRQYFTADDKLVYQAAADRMWVLDAATLKIVDEKMTRPDFGENHDVQPSPDGKYALLTVRVADTIACDTDGKPTPDKKITDGAIVLYDTASKKLVGKATSVCFGCHKENGKGDKNAVLCGLATTWKK